MSFITVKELAARLRISERHAYRVVLKMPRVRIGQSLRITEDAFAKYLEQQTEAPWQPESSNDAKAATGTATTKRQKASESSKASRPRTEPSQDNAPSNTSWLRPLRRAGGGKH